MVYPFKMQLPWVKITTSLKLQDTMMMKLYSAPSSILELKPYNTRSLLMTDSSHELEYEVR